VDGLHLYCVMGGGTATERGPIGPDFPTSVTGLGGRPVEAVRHGDLAAAVSFSPVRDYRSLKKEEVLAALFAHQAAIEQLMQTHTVVPVKFGTLAGDPEEVRVILERGEADLRSALEAVEGKIEVDLVARWSKLEPILREIGEEEDIRQSKAAVSARGTGATREQQIEIGRLVKARLDQRREERAAEIMDDLKPLARDLCPHALLDAAMILNVALLVERARERALGQALARLNDRYGERIDFRCVGPLPPYSFSTVEVQRFAPAEIERARGLLGVAARASLPDIKAAYRRFALQHHPDRRREGPGKGGPFADGAEAYRMLAGCCQAPGAGRAPKGNPAIAVRLLGRGGAAAAWPAGAARA
jgi:hypothetical protein